MRQQTKATGDEAASQAVRSKAIRSGVSGERAGRGNVILKRLTLQSDMGTSAGYDAVGFPNFNSSITLHGNRER